jgi:murein DD-endopeptidase MepM/ murein hydrolase activator NlpD
VPGRPNHLILAALALFLAMLLALPRPAWPAGWSWPVHGDVVGVFHVRPGSPFAPGQRRGIVLAAPPGARVRAACAGRVSFAGALPRRGLGLSVRCGRLTATYLGLGRLGVTAGRRVRAGGVLGALGRGGRLRLGARVTARRRGYLDPLVLLGDRGPHRQPPPPGPIRWRPIPRALRRPTVRALPPPRPTDRLPALAWVALGLCAAGVPLGGLVHGARTRRRVALARAPAGQR